MIAYVLHDIDSAQFVDVPVPEVGPGEVLIRAKTASLNPHDDHVLRGFARAYLEYDLPAVLGTDIAGVVEEIGPDVTRVAVGDRVFGLERSARVHSGTFSELVVLPQGAIAKTPDNVDDAVAGTLGLAAVMAVNLVDAVDLEGRTVLINGATGGVGCFLTQLAVRAGAQVLATARAGVEAELLSRLGATTTIDWSSEDVAATTAAAGRVDVVFDLVNRDKTAVEQLSSAALRPDGRTFTTLVQDGEAQFLMALSTPEMLDRIADVASAGLIVHLQSSFALADIDQAFAAVRSGTLGKLGLTIA